MRSLRSSSRTLLANLATESIRLGLGTVFLVSSLFKLRQPWDFLNSVYDYRLVGPLPAILITVVLPYLELLLGLCLLSRFMLGGALFTVTVLCAAFASLQASAMIRGIDISCGCFSASGGNAIDGLTVLRTFFLWGIALFAFVRILWIQRPERKA